MKELVEVDGLDALLVGGRKLLEFDPGRFNKLLSLCRTYVSIYERPNEADEVFLSRVREVSRPKASA